jgi:hypothetical protein
MQHKRRINRREQLLIEDIERLTKLLTTSSTCEARDTAAMLLQRAKADLESYKTASATERVVNRRRDAERRRLGTKRLQAVDDRCRCERHGRLGSLAAGSWWRSESCGAGGGMAKGSTKALRIKQRRAAGRNKITGCGVDITGEGPPPYRVEEI